MGSTLPLYTLLLLPSSPSPIDSPLFYHTISQYDLHTIIRQQQEQLVAMQAQIQALIIGGVGVERGAMGSNMGSQIEIAKPPVFNREVLGVART